MTEPSTYVKVSDIMHTIAAFVIAVLLIAALYSCGMANLESNDYKWCVEAGVSPAECAENPR